MGVQTLRKMPVVKGKMGKSGRTMLASKTPLSKKKQRRNVTFKSICGGEVRLTADKRRGAGTFQDRVYTT